ncbi:MAG: FecR family protein [Ferruginibacter sp.]
MNKDRIWTLLSRKLAGEATAAELVELEGLLEQYPEMDIPASLVEEHWNIPAEADDDFLEATYHLHTQKLKKLGHDLELTRHEDAGLLNIEENGHKASRKRILWGTGLMAAAALVFVLFFSRGNSAEQGITKVAESEVSTKNGSRSKLTLPDGTQVWLNSDSKLVYDNENFGNGTREVSLTGEAYFDVVKNTAKPFIIHTQKINIKVLGTAFNVKAYPEDKLTETSLIRGKIEVTIKNRPNDKIILSPNEKLIVENNEIVDRKVKALPAGRAELPEDTIPPQVSVNKLVPSVSDNSIVETAWVNNRLVFRDESFEDVAVRMERWYNTEIEIQGEALKQQHLNGVFMNESVTQALDALKISIAFKYRIEGQKIIIYH